MFLHPCTPVSRLVDGHGSKQTYSEVRAALMEWKQMLKHPAQTWKLHLTRLETRTKESDVNASLQALYLKP